jgi:predicted ArsR family transcriptional regulator
MARSADPGTSWIAAAKAKRRKPTALLVALGGLAHEPATADQLAARTGQHLSTVSRRLTDLGRLGLAETTGKVQPSSTGALARVWQITNYGRQRLRADGTGGSASRVASTGTGTTSITQTSTTVAQIELFPAAERERQWGTIR